MDKIIEFLKLVFSNEQQAIALSYKKDTVEDHNEFVKKRLNVHLKNVFEEKSNKVIPFNLRNEKLRKRSQRYYDRTKDLPYPNKRHLYKISEYKNCKHEKIWVCYVSIANPYNDIKSYDSVFIVSEIENNLKIIAKFNKDFDTSKWEFRGGDRELDFYKLGELINVNRIMAPDDDEWSVKEHMKEA